MDDGGLCLGFRVLFKRVDRFDRAAVAPLPANDCLQGLVRILDNETVLVASSGRRATIAAVIGSMAPSDH